MKIKTILISLSTLLVSCSGAQNKTETTDVINVAEKGKALVVFFSHAGDNTRVGNIEVGNTKIVADYISEVTGAEQFEVVCEKDYNMSYRDLCDLAKEEKENGELPPYTGRIENLDQYNVIFVGTPIWWNTFPQVMFSFFRDHNLNGKVLVPFVTHEGSKFGSTLTDLQKQYPEATITGAFEMRGQHVRTQKDKVVEWLKTLGYNN